MAVSSNMANRFAFATALRGLLMLLAGIYAVFWPAQALTVLVLAGGILLVIDGLLGLWSLTFGGGKSGNYWFDVVANVLSLILGVLILISPWIATVLTATFLVYLVALSALIVGGMQIYIIIKERDSYARIWPVLLSGAIYVLFGIALFLAPLFSAVLLVVFSGILLIFFSFGLFGWAWRLHKIGKAVESV
ncbi:hypothetical protein VW29_04970 [Devosia limi DSM 17137]|uniref:Uncharacterized membrane protein HdeD, DUF308 family n=1 Tax=Devosia limi DSM 17137 TaxID=1121477 RepID=A0A0F5LUE1_9HYPH|nr:DUF308 domain-containing protein [Devosia limi]KKB85958.1 hypothetical protein VW29_04970 [Devosia limi DSM 17137]SHF00513.1 Uncharacterized membrane protein HdeD, DUF308 family [Devosia limi DSM 17137]